MVFLAILAGDLIVLHVPTRLAPYSVVARVCGTIATVAFGIGFVMDWNGGSPPMRAATQTFAAIYVLGTLLFIYARWRDERRARHVRMPHTKESI